MPKATIRERLMNDLCVDLGFCLPPDDTARLLAWENPDVTAFTDAVFKAEGMVQPYDLHLYRQVRNRVAEALRHEPP
ncbi:MAG: hypothetical protein ACJ735_11320 [Actinomycetes bacterium]